LDKEKYSLKMGDIVIARTGANTGANSTIRLEEDAVFASYLIRFRIDPKQANPFFVGYILKSSLWQNFVTSILGGSAQPGANAKQMGFFSLPVPSPSEQKDIAKILSDLDTRIEINQQMNETLETIGQAVFKRWFVDFEFPNEEGKPYKSSGGEMVYNEEWKKEIPKEWEVGCIEDVAHVIGGGTPSTKMGSYFTNNGIPWLTPKDLSGYEGKFIEKGATDLTEEGLKNSSAKLMPKGTILFTSRAPIGYVAIALNDIATNQGFKSLVPKDNMKSEYLYQYIRKITPYVQSISSGSTFGEVTGSTMKQIKILIPECGILENFEAFINPINARIINDILGVRTLTKIRDLILPRLMSGKIRITVEKGADKN
jgi:type I restriction enzyme S subunit